MLLAYIYLHKKIEYKNNLKKNYKGFIIMKFLIQQIINRFKKIKMPLGRWSLEYCPQKINSRIDYYNQDHSLHYEKNEINPVNPRKINITKINITKTNK